MFSCLQEKIGEKSTVDKRQIKKILTNDSFTKFGSVNVLSLIYNEKTFSFKIIVFDLEKAYDSVKKIEFLPPRKQGKTKKTFPIYKFYDNDNQYIFEIRYGDVKANALQRGMWTHTEKANPFFNKVFSGKYEINQPLISLISKILISNKKIHEDILELFPKV